MTHARTTRRDFLRCALACGACCSVAAAVPWALAGERDKGRPRGAGLGPLKEALFWEPLPGGAVRCTTCPNQCQRDEGGVTLCRTRVNKGGKLHTLTYGRPCMICDDPIAKNPLFHVDPGAIAIGVATAGCNLTCKYCQNWDISQKGPGETKNFDVSPEELVRKATDRRLRWLTFSYTEPVAYLEYAIDAAKIAREKGVKVAMVTAGFIAERPLAELIKVTDAFSVTFKGNTDAFYKDVCGGGVEPVRKSLALLAKSGRWLEVVILIVPGLNDSPEDLRAMVRYLAGLGKHIPLHFLRFVPEYKLRNLLPTPLATLEKARDMAKREGMEFVYIDIPGHRAASTYCPGCDKPLIERAGFTIIRNDLKKGSCPHCSRKIPGLML